MNFQVKFVFIFVKKIKDANYINLLELRRRLALPQKGWNDLNQFELSCLGGPSYLCCKTASK